MRNAILQDRRIPTISARVIVFSRVYVSKCKRQIREEEKEIRESIEWRRNNYKVSNL